MRVLACLCLVAALAACGQRADLKPGPGRQLPVAPYGREEPRSVEGMLESPVQAAPERSIELRKRSEERADDPFDLPPKE
jgi:hypothetical protein